MTNGDRIRQMSDDELADFLGNPMEEFEDCHCCFLNNHCTNHEYPLGTTCTEIVRSWLKQ